MPSIDPGTLTCPVWSKFLGHAGVTFAMGLSSDYCSFDKGPILIISLGVGAAYGTAKAGAAIAAIGTVNPGSVMTALIPIIMAGILSIYGLVISIFIATSMDANTPYPLFAGALHLSAGMCVGLCSLASGIAIGLVGDAGVRGLVKQPRLFVGLVLILIFSEVLGLYGLLTGVIMHTKARSATC